MVFYLCFADLVVPDYEGDEVIANELDGSAWVLARAGKQAGRTEFALSPPPHTLTVVTVIGIAHATLQLMRPTWTPGVEEPGACHYLTAWGNTHHTATAAMSWHRLL